MENRRLAALARGAAAVWTTPYLWAKNSRSRGVQYLLTFRPFATLPATIQQAYLAGKLHLLPCPASLLFWGVPGNLHLQHELPFAAQVPLAAHRSSAAKTCTGLRVPQSGWLHEPRPDEPQPDDPHLALHNTYLRTHRWAKLHRHEDELAVLTDKAKQHEDKLLHVLFSTDEDDLGLYGKPMARNVQLWTQRLSPAAGWPRASREEIAARPSDVVRGRAVRLSLPVSAMRVGMHEVYWHRPLVAYLDHAD